MSNCSKYLDVNIFCSMGGKTCIKQICRVGNDMCNKIKVLVVHISTRAGVGGGEE